MMAADANGQNLLNRRQSEFENFAMRYGGHFSNIQQGFGLLIEKKLNLVDNQNEYMSAVAQSMVSEIFPEKLQEPE